MYFGASFSRYGFDFRPLFIQFFSQTTLTNFQNSLQEANRLFEQLLSSYTFDQYVQITTSDSSTTSTNPFSPPMILVNYTPLAVYCNILLTAFNDLRLCCPLSIVLTIKQLVSDSLVYIRNILSHYYKSEHVTLTIIESEHFIDFLRVFTSIFIPYINTCIQALFPDAQLARELGVTVLDVAEKSKLNQLDVDFIIEPIKNIIDSVMLKKKPQTSENIPSETAVIPHEKEKEQNSTFKVEEEEEEKVPEEQEKIDEIDNKSDVIE